MTTQAEEKRMLADRLVLQAECLNAKNDSRLKQHLVGYESMYGRSIESLIPFEEEIELPRNDTFLCWLFPFYFRKQADQEILRIMGINDKIREKNEGKKEIISKITGGDSKVMNEFIQKFMKTYDNFYDGTEFELYVNEDGRSMSANVSIPNEENILQVTYVARKTALDIIEKTKSKKAIYNDHSLLTHSTLLRIAATCFTLLPTIMTIDEAAFTKRRSRITGQFEDECILYGIFDREKWGKIDFRHVDAIEVYKNFDFTRDFNKTGLLSNIGIKRHL